MCAKVCPHAAACTRAGPRARRVAGNADILHAYVGGLRVLNTPVCIYEEQSADACLYAHACAESVGPSVRQ